MSLAKVNITTGKHFLLGVDIFTHTHTHTHTHIKRALPFPQNHESYKPASLK